MRHARSLVCLGLFWLAALSLSALASEHEITSPGDVLMVQGAPGVIHFSSSPQYVDYSWLVGIEWQRPSNWLGGYAYFNNSFGQKCHYLYLGKTWQLGERSSNWYVKLTGGVIEGYKQPFEDKLPINHNGIGPAIVPGLGYRYDRFNVQVNLIGVKGVMFTVGYDLYRR